MLPSGAIAPTDFGDLYGEGPEGDDRHDKRQEVHTFGVFLLDDVFTHEDTCRHGDGDVVPLNQNGEVQPHPKRKEMNHPLDEKKRCEQGRQCNHGRPKHLFHRLDS